MADFTERLTLLITVDSSGAVGVLKGFGDTAKTELTKVEGVAGTTGSRAGAAFGDNFSQGAQTALASFQAAIAGFGAAKVIAFGKDAVTDAVAYERATAALGAAIDGVGAKSGITKTGVDHLSDSIQNQDAIFKGDVKSAATLFVAMENIRNAAGKGNDVFNRALSVSAAIANVQNRDITTVATQLGRALDNPSSNIQAFSRTGVPLSAELRAQVTELAKRGDLEGAQKALLDDLERRYLAIGAAAAKADPLQQLSVATKEFKTQIGTDILPGVTVLLDLTKGLFSGFEHLPAPMRGTAEALLTIAAVVIPLQKLHQVMESINTIADRSAVVNTAGSGTAVAATTDAQGTAATRTAAKTTTLSAAQDKLAASGARVVDVMGAEQGALGGLDASLATTETELASTEAALLAMGVAPDQAAAAVANLRAQMAALDQTAVTVDEALAVTDVELQALQADLAALGAEPEQVAAAFAALQSEISGLGAGSAGLGELEAMLVSLGVDADTLALALANVDRELILVNGVAIEFATTEELLAARAQLLAKSEEEAVVATRSLASALGTIGLVVGGALLLNNVLDGVGKNAPEVDRLTQSIVNLNKSGEVSGALKEALGGIDPRALKEINLEQKDRNPLTNLPGVSQLFGVGEKIGFGITGQLGPINTAKADVKALDEAMASLVSKGDVQSANAAFQQFGQGPEANGAKFPKFFQALTDWQAQEEAAGKATQDATAILDSQAGVFAKLGTTLDLQSGLEAVQSAQEQVVADYQDIAGVSQKAKDADKAEADSKRSLSDATRGVGDSQRKLSDSYVRLADAQEKVAGAEKRVTDSQHQLLEAQQDLDLYNSARGQQERSLQLDVIKRRVITTPAESDQKQLDLLKFTDDNSKKQQDLTDRVASAQQSVQDAVRGVRDAVRGVADAVQGVSDAEHNQETAVLRVRDAQDRVTVAVEKRKAVSADASSRIKADVEKEQKALLTIVTALETARTKGDLNNTEIEKWIFLLQGAADKMNGPVSTAVDALAGKVKALTPDGAAGVGGAFGATGPAVPPGLAAAALDPRLAPGGAQTADWLKGQLHAAGVPGFDSGGMVPGLPGAPLLAVVHGGERVLTPQQQRELGGGVTLNQENHFHGETPTHADLEYANRQAGWRLARAGRR